jgi:hypothetical protein
MPVEQRLVFRPQWVGKAGAPAKSREAWPDAELEGPLQRPTGESCGRTPEGERVPLDASRTRRCGGLKKYAPFGVLPPFLSRLKEKHRRVLRS